MFRYQPLDQEKLEIRLVRFILDDHGNDDYRTDKPDDGGDSNDAGSRQRRSSDARSDCTSGPGPRSDCVLGKNIAMELRTVSLKEASIEYAALSYVWGNSDDIINITLDGHDFSVRRHLHAALEQLRGWNLTSWLWIDSICIQQSDDVEKSWQVNAMHEVFKRARLVYAWIGPGSTKTDTAMDYLARVGPRALACPEDPGDDLYNWMSSGLLDDYRALQEGKGSSSRGVQQTTGLLPLVIELLEEGGLYCPGSRSKPGLFTDATGALEGFQDMLSRQYWQRIWVIQEIALPQDVLLVCGGKCISVDAFSIVVNILHFGAWVFKYHRRPMGGDEDVPGLSSWSTFTERRPKALQVRRVIRSGQALRLADILLNWSIPADGEVYLTASDPRDLVFGVLAIVQDEQHGMIADYSLPHEDVFSMVTRALHGCNALQPSGDKFDLDCCSPKRGPTALPSWVPDWGEVSRHGFNDVFLQPIDVSRQFQATDSMDVPLYRTANDRQVRVLDRFGCRFDTITEVMPRPKPSQESYPEKAWSAFLHSIPTFASSGSKSKDKENGIYRTILAPKAFKVFRDDNAEEEVLTVFRKAIFQSEITAGGLNDQLKRLNLQSSPELLRVSLWFELKGRTFFKTARGSFGLGHQTMRPGDVVTLLSGITSPIILRPRECGDGFIFVGDAYVDEIMHGEFIRTSPTNEVFRIH